MAMRARVVILRRILMQFSFFILALVATGILELTGESLGRSGQDLLSALSLIAAAYSIILCFRTLSTHTALRLAGYARDNRATSHRRLAVLVWTIFALASIACGWLLVSRLGAGARTETPTVAACVLYGISVLLLCIVFRITVTGTRTEPGCTDRVLVMPCLSFLVVVSWPRRAVGMEGLPVCPAFPLRFLRSWPVGPVVRPWRGLVGGPGGRRCGGLPR